MVILQKITSENFRETSLDDFFRTQDVTEVYHKKTGCLPGNFCGWTYCWQYLRGTKVRYLQERYGNRMYASGKNKGRGVMTEAVAQICELVFEQLDIVHITGNVCAPNVASQRVLLKNGFLLEGIMKQAVYKDAQLRNLHIYGKYSNKQEIE